MLDDEVKASWIQLQKNLRAVFEEIDQEYYREPTFVPAWDEWWCDWSQYHFKRSQSWITDIITEMTTVWAAEPHTDPSRIMVLNTLMQLDGLASAILTFDNSIFENCR